MRLFQDVLSEIDIEKLENFRKQIQKDHPDLAQLVQSQIQNLTQTFQRKRKLLKELSSQIFPKGSHRLSQRLTDEQEINLYVKSEQILNNPFEPSIDAVNFLQSSYEKTNDPELRQLIQILQKKLTKIPKEKRISGI